MAVFCFNSVLAYASTPQTTEATEKLLSVVGNANVEEITRLIQEGANASMVLVQPMSAITGGSSSLALLSVCPSPSVEFVPLCG